MEDIEFGGAVLRPVGEEADENGDDEDDGLSESEHDVSLHPSVRDHDRRMPASMWKIGIHCPENRPQFGMIALSLSAANPDDAGH